MFYPEGVQRSKEGLWVHSALVDWEEVDIRTLPVSQGMQFHLVEFFSDAPVDLQARYDSAGLLRLKTETWGDVLNEWSPTVPEGEGWFLCAIYDTEDGPHACFARPRVTEGQ